MGKKKLRVSGYVFRVKDFTQREQRREEVSSVSDRFVRGRRNIKVAIGSRFTLALIMNFFLCFTGNLKSSFSVFFVIFLFLH